MKGRQTQTKLRIHPELKAAGQEMTQFETMLDPYDTQINAIYDDLVCLVKVTPPAQGILPGAVWATRAMEQPTIGKIVPIIPMLQAGGRSNATCTRYPTRCRRAKGSIGAAHHREVGSSRHAPRMAAPLRTPTALAIPKVVLNVRPVRRRFPAAAVRSPFLHDDIRGGDTFDHYLHLEDGGMRNVGHPCGVGKTFFEEIINPDKQLHIEHIKLYMAILSSRPNFAGLKEVHSNIALSSYFMETVKEVFDVMHRDMRAKFQRYDHNLFDPTIEEIPVEEMDMLCLFAEVVQPNWGDNMKQWIECDKVVTVCNYNDHWGTILLDLKR
ncbi:hypothetical protein OROHE_010912 [Orobanche hederae]